MAEQQQSQRHSHVDRVPGQRTELATGPATGVRIPGQRLESPAGPAATPVVERTVAAAPDAGWEALPWRTVARVSACRSLLTLVLTMLVLAVLPLAVGWTPRVIMSGSMEPSIHTGDVVVTRPVDGSEIGRGTVLTSVDPDKPGKTRTHRMVERDEDGMVVTKGDANPDADSSPVPDSDVLGAGVLRVPYVGLPAHWLSVGQLAPVGLALVVLTGAVLGSFRPRTPRTMDDSRRGGGTGTSAGGPHRPARRVRARGRRARRAGAAVTLTMATALVVTAVPGSYAAFSAKPATPASSFSAGGQFYPYRDAVLGDAPSFFWRLNEAAGGFVADASGNNRNATADGGVVFGRDGALVGEPGATAAGFEGGVVLSSGSVASVSANFSVETWVRTTSTAGGPLVALTSAANTGVIDRALYLGTDGAVRFGRQGSLRVAGPRVNDGQWHHVVYTNSSTGNPSNQRARLYVDGQLVATSSAVTGSTTGYWDAGRSTFAIPLLWNGNPDNTFRGDLDEIAVYTDVLTAAEVQDHYVASGR
ncbi:signal peptidase I [Nocardioides marmoraquaticus]